MKARGWVALVAGAFIVILIGGIWIWLGGELSAHRITLNGTASRTFMGQVFVAFALFIVAGFVGMLNGVYQIRTGKANRALAVLMIVLVLSAVGTMVFAVSTDRS